MRESRLFWDRRAAKLGTSKAGVLFKDFSDVANQALHAWHVGVVAQKLLPFVQPGGRLLDLGCGYGRIAAEIRARRADVDTVGQDISLSYCAEFAKRAGSAVQGSLERPPFSENSFNAVIAVTSMMYVDPSRRGEVLQSIGSLLKNGGYMLLIDPGAELQKIVSAIKGNGLSLPSLGAGFALDEHSEIAVAAGLNVLETGGNPAFTRRVLVFRGKPSGQWQSRSIEASVARDLRSGRNARFVIHRWALLQRN